MSCWRRSPGSRRPTSTRCSTPSARTCSTPRRTLTAAPDRCPDFCTLANLLRAPGWPHCAQCCGPSRPFDMDISDNSGMEVRAGGAVTSPGDPPVEAPEVPVLPLLLLPPVHGGLTSRTCCHDVWMCLTSVLSQVSSCNAGELPAWNCRRLHRAKLHLHLSKVTQTILSTSPVSP